MAEKVKPKLKNLDDLFYPAEDRSVGTVTKVALDGLAPFSGHLFRLYEGERLDDMVESIRATGVLVPILTRRVENVLETLAGHNRVAAAKLAGLTEIPAIVMDGVSDDEAMIYVVETNLMQRSFTDLTHSEKAAVISLHHGKMFSQGKRNDVLARLESLSNSGDGKGNTTSRSLRCR